MSDAAPLSPADEEPVRRMRPGTTSLPDAPAKSADADALPEGVKIIRQTPYMTEVYVDEALIGVVQATSTAEGPWEFRYMPGWTNRDAAERAAGPMCRAAVDARR